MRSPIKILVVDDKPSNLIAMEAALGGQGYEIIEALSGKEALEFVMAHDFACILLDVQMPIMDGFETALQIRREPRSKTTPIIFVTAIHRSEEYEHFGYDAGAVDYLFKPINPKVLQSKVAIFVELHRQAELIKLKNLQLEEAIEKVRESERLKAALSARDEFLSLASHELKTPITPLTLQMQTFIHLFESGTMQTIGPERMLRMLKTSQGQIERLSRLISELVDVSRISTNKLELNKSWVNLAHLLEKVITDFAEQIAQSGSEIILWTDENVEGHWDAFRIEQVIVNLITNALKYGNGKPVQVVVSRIDENRAKFCVQDNGIGIPKEDQERIFRRFERAVSGQSYSGLGLGLYITEQILQQHGGKILVESESGKGSTFIVELPLRSSLS